MEEGVAVDTFGPYRLDVLLGQGGMGEVWRAYDTTKDRAVALKRLPSHLAENPEFRVRFEREARIAAQLREPHIIPIHEYGEIDGQLFVDMRLVDGVDLGAALAQFGPLHPVRAVEVTSQIASALDAAHAAGLVHRAVKPSNVLLAGQGPEWDFVYLIDFGISHGADDTRVTYTDAGVSTPADLAPERYRGRGNHRADIYALGGLLYTMLTGTSPSPRDGSTQRYDHLHTPPPAPSQHRPELAGGLDEVVATAMAKDSKHGYPTAGALAAAAHAALATLTHDGTAGPTHSAVLDQRLDDPHPPADTPPAGPTSPGGRWIRRRSVLVAGLVLTTLAVAGAILVAHQNPARIRDGAPTAAPTVVATIPVRAYPIRVAVAPDGRHAYTGNNGADNVSVIDTATNAVTSVIWGVGHSPDGVAITPDGRHGYIANGTSGTVSVIDTATNAVTTTIPVGKASWGVSVTPDGKHVYIANPGANTVSVIDTATNTVTATIPVGRASWGVSVTPDGRHVYITNPGANTVSVIDTATNTVTATIPVGRSPDAVVVAPDGRRAYVTNPGANTVSVIDTATNTVTATIPAGGGPFGLAVAPDGGHAYTTNSNYNSVSVIDTTTNTVTATIPVGDYPESVAITPDGRHAYVANAGSNSVWVLALAPAEPRAVR